MFGTRWDYEDLTSYVGESLLEKNTMEDNFNLNKALLLRFVRGAIAGAVGSMVSVNIMGVSTFSDLKVFLTSLALSGIVGAISGGLLALDKYIRAK